MNDNEIKSLTPTECPHCKKPFLIEVTMTAPLVKGLHTDESLRSAKDIAIMKINRLHIPELQKKEAVEWVNNPETVFTASDVDTILNNINESNTKIP